MATASARPSRRSTTAFPPPRNALGTLEWITPNKIKVDPSYQRPELDAHIRKIAMNFDFASLKAISVNRRPDGTLVAIDGQQEVAAVKLRGDIPKVPCYVTNLDTVEKEAKSFADMNGDRKRLDALALHRARVVAGNPQAIAVQAAAERAGIILVMGASGTGKCNAVGSLTQWAGKRKPTEIRAELDLLFNFLQSTWQGDPKMLSGRFVMGMLRFLSQIGADARERVLASPERLARNKVDFYLRKAAARADATDSTIVKAMPDVLREAFNANLPAKSRI